ncbi:MAG: GNAT family N-acetyltransferase [Candidatus Aenigmarchaeota archaeon]|nr:GNAT family N-acetyltransferase [Candidatus Aenigmarchaeota archaeon]
MLTGKIVEEFKIGKDSFKIRYPKFEDYKGLQESINSLVEEWGYLNEQKKISRKEVIESTTDLLKKIENKESVALVVEVNGKVKGDADIDKKKHAQNHICDLGISLGKEIRGKGIGKRLMELLIREAKKNLKTEIIEIEVFAENKVALNLYKKFGFKKIGIIKKGFKKKGKYYDKILMVKYL